MRKGEIITRIDKIKEQTASLSIERSEVAERHFATVQANSVLDEIVATRERNSGKIALLSLERKELEDELKAILEKE